MPVAERVYDLERRRQKRASTSNVPRRKPKHPKDVLRFAPLETDDLDAAAEKAAGFMRWYMADKFSRPFTVVQMKMIRAVLSCMKYGGDDAQAAPRGGGKTSIVEGLVIYAVLYGLIKFPVVIAATDDLASDVLDNIKYEVAYNERLIDDFPELDCVAALEGRPQRAISQTYDGEPTHLSWGGGEAVFPSVTGSKSSGAVIRTFGILGAIRGTRHRNQRPDFCLIDDPETRKSAKSPTEVIDREQAIDKDISGLAGPGKKIARVALVTIQNKECLAAKLTDRNIKPSFCGQRHRLLVQPPKRPEMWQEYIRLRQEDSQKGDRWGRSAHAYYLANRESMDEGSEVSDPYRFVADVLPDGSQVEASTLQAYYNFVADKGQAAASAELDNDPPEESGPQESGITPVIVQSRINAFARRQVPSDCTVLTAYIDLGKYGCHWTTEAWRPGATGFVIDYGVADVFNTGTAVNSQVVDYAIVNTLRQWRETMGEEPYRRDNEPVKFDMVLVDSSDFTDAAYAFCKEAGPPFYAAKGFGQGRFYPGVTNHAKGHVAGQHWYTQIQPNGVKLVGLEADHWKLLLHNFFMTATFDKEQNFKESAISLFSPGNNKREHQTFAHHICAEIWTEEHIPDKGVRRGFKSKSKNNHWLDATAGAMAAAFMCGIRVVGETKQRKAVNIVELAKQAGYPVVR